MKRRWLITDKGDPDARRLVDGESFGAGPHYSRRTPGAVQFTRNGQNLVFISPCHRAVWVTFRPTPGIAERPDGLKVWECALFRNEGAGLSSELIMEAEELTYALWGSPPEGGLISFVRADKVRPKANPGYCYLKAGWRLNGTSLKGYLKFVAPPRAPPRPFWTWQWHHDRGGKMRGQIEPLVELLR